MSLAFRLILFFFCFPVFMATAAAQEYTSGPYTFSVKSTQQISVDFRSKELDPQLIEVTFNIKANDFLASELSINWSVPFVNIAGCWTPNGNDARFIRMGSVLQANLASQAPVLSLFGNNSDNRYTFALSDAFHQTTMRSSVNEDNASLSCSATILPGKEEKLNSYRISILLDNRSIAFAQSLKKVSSWWEAMAAYQPSFVPDAAKQPVYSTWYSYHQRFTESALLKECRDARTMGYETLILDDGWQTKNPGAGYAYTGDWNSERIADMAGFVKKIQHTGMKFMLWYSVPFIGYRAASYEQFKGKYLYQSDRLSAAVLDPRYPQVRKFLVDKYMEDVRSWNLDGLKLDFIDSFVNKPEEIPAVGQDADFLSLYAAVDQLMLDVKKSLTILKPSILIEFRQSYIGPAMRKYGNMFRAGDCPNAALTNRIRTTDLKLLAGTTAVHADMLMWNAHESAHLAALQFSNVLFAVPQLSVKLAALPAAHLNMVKFYTRYWIENKAILLDGTFTALNPELNYPVLMASKQGKTIVGLYADMAVPLNVNDFTDLDVVNAKNSATLVLNLSSAITCRVEIYDCQGVLKSKNNLQLSAGSNGLTVPLSGIVKLHKIN